MKHLLARARQVLLRGERVDIEGLCRAHPALMPELEAELKKLERVAAAMFRSADVDRSAPRIDGYQIIERLGQGGMGEVYRADQFHPFKRQVAIKRIRPGFDTKAVIARFESERQALARMDHPHIAKVLDAGSDSRDHPYFVMEYVPGQPIVEFADAHRLSIAQRLNMFLQVCDAIAHAHTKALLHRDIKSTNVLVYLVDEKPFVKVIDFGIAKALTDERLADHSLYTRAGDVIGTYGYMSPEQASGDHDIDTRTDVYSLGVLLYELLAGAPPFSAEEIKLASDEAMQKLIREKEPPRPSHRLTQLGAPADSVAKARQTTLHALRQELTSELDWIPMMALRKERDRRYASVADLAGDIRNYLENRPLKARPDSAWYRLRKTVRRNRTPLLIASLVSLVILTAAGFVSWRVSHERQRTQEAQAAEERERIRADTARAAAEKNAEQLKQFNDGLQATRARASELERVANAVQRASETSDSRFDAGSVEGRAERLSVVAEQARTEATAFEASVHGAERFAQALRTNASETSNGTDKGARSPMFAQGVLVRSPRRVPGVETWTIETAQARGEIFGLAYSPDSRFIAGACEERVIRIWDISTGKQVRCLIGHEDEATCVAWSPDGKLLASGSEDGSVRLWEPATGREVAVLEGHLASTRAVSWSPDGKKLVSASYDKTARIWDIASLKAIYIYRGHTSGVASVSWSAYDDLIATSGHDQTVQVWRAATGELVETLRKPKPYGTQYTMIAWSPDGGRLAWSDNVLNRIWDARTRSDVPIPNQSDFGGNMSSVGWSPDGRWLFGPTKSPLGKGMVEINTGRFVPALSKWPGVNRAGGWAPDGKTAAIGDGGGALWLFEPPENRLIAKFANQIITVKAAEWSRRGDRVAIGAFDGQVTIWDARRMSPLKSLTGRKSRIFTLNWSSDEKYLAAGSHGEPLLHVWEVETGQLAHVLEMPSADIRHMRFAPDRPVLALACSDFKIRLIDLNAPRNPVTLSAHNDWARHVAWSPDGRKLASADRRGEICVWDSEQQTLLFKTIGHESEVRSLEWSPDGDALLSSADDRTVRVWDGNTGRPRLMLTGHRDRVPSASWSADGQEIISIGVGNIMRRWSARWGTLLNSREVVGPAKFSPNGQAALSISAGAVAFWNPNTGRDAVVLLPFNDNRYALLSENGSCSGTEGIENELVVIAKTAEGQTQLTLAEFARKFGWQNEPMPSRATATPPIALARPQPAGDASPSTQPGAKRGAVEIREPSAIERVERIAAADRSIGGDVIRIRVSGQTINENDLAAIRDLPQLSEVFIPSRCPIGDRIVSALSGKSTITLLVVDGESKITDESMKAVATWPSLRRLELWHNPVTDQGVEQLRGLKKLAKLSLGGTKVTDHGLDVLNDLPAISELIVPPATTDRGVEQLSKARSLQTSLRDLNLAHSGVTAKSFEFLPRFQNLQSLQLNRLPVADSDIPALARNQRLTTLCLDDTSITDAGLEQLGSLIPTITSVSLARTRIADTGLYHLTLDRRLNTLNLHSTNVGDQGLAHLKQLSELESLDLGNTRVSFNGLIQHLPEMVSLTRLTLSPENGVSAEQLGQLYRACPWMAIDIPGANNDGTAPSATRPKLIRRLSEVADIERDPAGAITGVTVKSPLFGDDDMASLRGLPKLKSFNTNYVPTQITDRGLKHLTGKKSLIHLSLISAEGVTDAGMTHLNELSNLETLTLMGTQVSNASLARLDGLKKLYAIGLYNTKASGDGIEVLGNFPNLYSLSIGSSAQPSDTTIEKLSSVVPVRDRIVVLYLHSVKLTTAGIRPLAAFPNLAHVSLHRTTLSDEDYLLLTKVPKLNSIDISGTSISDAGLIAIVKAMPRLEVLYIGGNDRLTDECMPALAEAPNLKFVSLGFTGTPITDAGIAHLVKSPNIEDLDLFKTKITDAGLVNSIAKMPKLKRVTVRKSELITDAGIAQLRAARPDLEIKTVQ